VRRGRGGACARVRARGPIGQTRCRSAGSAAGPERSTRVSVGDPWTAEPDTKFGSSPSVRRSSRRHWSRSPFLHIWPGRPLRNFFRRRLCVTSQKSNLPIQEIIKPAPGVNLALACDAVEDAEMRARAPMLLGLVDRSALWASKYNGDGRSCHLEECAPRSGHWLETHALRPCQPRHFRRLCAASWFQCSLLSRPQL
jgi:hypothetical protein